MNFFNYKNNILYAEDVAVEAIAEKVGTPLYIYSYETIKRHFLNFHNAFNSYPHIICYALKANPHGSILRSLAQLGSGADIVSGGELYRALRAGVPAQKIVYAGVGKTDDEIRYALSSGILLFNVESAEELENINSIASEMNIKASVALRVNPDIDPQTHPYISTGLKKHKFGIPINEALEFYSQAQKLSFIEIWGIHKHIGSQITQIDPFVEALKKVLVLSDDLLKQGIEVKYIDIGGGLGIRYNDETPLEPSALAQKILPLMKQKNMTLILEPGRSIVGNSGILVTKVLYRKKGEGKKFIIVDAGMNDMLRPSLYDAYHHIIPVKKQRKKLVIADIVGPICETGDFLARQREIEEPQRGELLAVMSAGAYGISMSSHYNSRPKVAEVLVKGNEFFVISQREQYRDMIKQEHIPEFLQ
jgi:diaminopimelate decarboxylase